MGELSKVEIVRDTPEMLFNNVLSLVKENNLYDNPNLILDYALPNTYDNHTKFTHYDFDFVPITKFGGSEGIYTDCYLQGKFDDSGKTKCKIGTFKTLNTDLGSFLAMSQLGGAMSYYVGKYININIDRYDS